MVLFLSFYFGFFFCIFYFVSFVCFFLSDGDDIFFFIFEDYYIICDWFICIYISEDGLVEGIDFVFLRGECVEGEWLC